MTDDERQVKAIYVLATLLDDYEVAMALYQLEKSIYNRNCMESIRHACIAQARMVADLRTGYVN